MRFRQITAFLIFLALSSQFPSRAMACGPEMLQPIFVMQNSPDPPFREFTQGKIGIVKPSFGRKTLVIAYRFLKGGSFTEQEQQGLIEALKGLSPGPDTEDSIKAWVEARKLVLKDESELPDIYQQQEYGSYDFFPNCTSNAFEVASETLNDRVAKYGAEDASVLEWLKAQDQVFRNCAKNSVVPTAVGPEHPVWLWKDRDYQNAAALFYSLKFEEARNAFQKIAQDAESPWQETADYLVGRTLVRQASLESDEATKRNLYESSETYLIGLLGRANKLRRGTQKLWALTKYRLRPEERVQELARVLGEYSGNENVRQDLIDYVWLLDKFDKQVQDIEEERRKLLKPPEPETTAPPIDPKSIAWQRNFELVERGELIQMWLPSISSDGQLNYSDARTFHFKPDASKTEIFETVELHFGRKLTEGETIQLWQRHAEALKWREYKLSPNRKFNRRDGYEGCDYHCNDLTLDLLPQFLRTDDLTDWIFTFQSGDPRSYTYALTRWRETGSEAWFVAALAKADKASPSLTRLLAHTTSVDRDSPLFATVAYNRVRLLRESGRESEARQLLDEIMTTRLDTLPLSAQNRFIELRMEMAQSISEFLRMAAKKPVTFYLSGIMGRVSDIFNWGDTDHELPDDQKAYLADLYKWDERMLFDEKAIDIVNWHFPLSALVAISHDQALPDYLRQRILFNVWTRAALLKNDQVAEQSAKEIVASGLDRKGVFAVYLNSPIGSERERAALFTLLKTPFLSPFLAPGVPENHFWEDDLAFGSWWCSLPETEYDDSFNEVAKKVPSPSFLSFDLLATGQEERAELKTKGDAKHYLGRKAIEWAKQSPQDPRVPEALFIAARANMPHKYGCGGWEQNEELRTEAERLLVERYSGTPWAAKLREMDQ